MYYALNITDAIAVKKVLETTAPSINFYMD